MPDISNLLDGNGDSKPYKEWIGRKEAAMRRPRLDCGHPRTDAGVFFHLWCDRLACSDECAEAEHDCEAYAGAKSSTDEEAEPPEVRRRPQGCVCPNDMPANEYQPGCPSCEEWVARLNAAVTTPREAVAARTVFSASPSTSPWVSFADVAAGPSAGDSAVDVRRRVQDGTAPAPDPVGDALRAEALRQGLPECEIDGVRWIYGAGHWIASPWPLVDPTLMLSNPTGDLEQDAATFRRLWLNGRVSDTAQPEPVSPLVDAAPELTYHRYECPHANCEWTKVALDRDLLLDLAEAHELEAHARLPWWNWKRWTR